MEVIHHGGKNTVTGSCHELRANGQAILVDCGLFQGADSRPLEIEFDTHHLCALLLTHSHIDHIGRLPWLLARGFNRPIYCTEATAEIAPLMLDDGLKLQGFSHNNKSRILKKIHSLIQPMPYNKWFLLPHKSGSNNQIDHGRPNTLLARFQPAGHILGSAYIEIKLPNSEVVVFSGDLGPNDTPLLPDPKPPERADYLFIESTYGSSDHQGITQRSNTLQRVIERSLKDGGTILIPAFSVGRTQELLFDIEQLIHQRALPCDLPIIIDSPMANKVTRSYRRFKALWGEEAKHKLTMKRHPLAFKQCITVDSHRIHKKLVNRLSSTGEPAIVVAASGMCQGGRIVNYLKALLPDPRTDVIFAGYQAQGTLGSALQQLTHAAAIIPDSAANQTNTAYINQQPVTVNAHIHTMSGYSAHAGQNDLLRFIQGISQAPKSVHLIHGEPETQQAFHDFLLRHGIPSSFT